MITQLKGALVEKTPTHLVIDCQGVGYEVNISLYTFGQIKDEEKKQPYRAPELGEHSKEILSSLGMDEDKINKLKENGAIEF